MARIWRLVLAVPLLGALACIGCGKSDNGEECDQMDDCKDGLVCTTDWQGRHCRQACTAQDQCPPGFDCNGVEGTNVKSCQPQKP
jgi:hypothetical protein